MYCFKGQGFLDTGVTCVPLAVCRIPTDDTLAIWPTWDWMKTKFYLHGKIYQRLKNNPNFSPVKRILSQSLHHTETQ